MQEQESRHNENITATGSEWCALPIHGHQESHLLIQDFTGNMKILKSISQLCSVSVYTTPPLPPKII